uniref:Uncharacterized protein n=1 Tax=Panagrolaimus davidi TaxID=227884 RepID=A0A914PS87_9BILA
MFNGVNDILIENSKIKITGYNIKMSKITKNVNTLYEENKNLSMIEIFSKNEVILDEHLIFPGINLLINAIKISIPEKIIIDLSGKDGEKLEDVTDEEGKLPGENGKDGKDGTAGNSSGNLCILAQDFKNMENLDIKLNGGRGSDGQNGENGVDGENGKSVNKFKVFNRKYKMKLAAKSAANFISRGAYSHFHPLEKSGNLKDGIYFYKSVSYKNGSTNSIYFYQGEKGKPGGMGGKNGLGGEGGFKGDCSIFIDGMLINEKIKVILET